LPIRISQFKQQYRSPNTAPAFVRVQLRIVM
jgi:hypothetical protein